VQQFHNTATNIAQWLDILYNKICSQQLNKLDSRFNIILEKN